MEATTIKLPSENSERLTPKDLVRKHIADRTHMITEEEFEKLIVGVFSSDILQERRDVQ